MTNTHTEYIFKNSKFRSQLINNILDGTITINQQACKCIYQIKPDKTDDESESSGNMTMTINLDKDGLPDKCSYATTLANLGYSLKYLGSGTYAFAAKVCEDDQCNLTYALKMIMYLNNTDAYSSNLNDPNRPENIEVTMLKRLNMEILYPKISPHITLYIQDFKCTGIPILWNMYDVSKDSEAFEKYIGDTISGGQEYYDNQAIIMLSEMSKYGSLHNFMINNAKIINEDWLADIFFQFNYTLAQIQNKWNGFRHNDCHLGNLLLQSDDNYGPMDEVIDRYYIYYYMGSYFKFNITKFQLKFWDFDFSNIFGITNNQRSKAFAPEEFGYRHNSNHYYDLHLFVNNILNISDHLLSIPKHSPLMNLFKSIVPTEYQGMSKNNVLHYSRLIPDIQLTTPDEIMKNKYLMDKYAIDLDQIDIDKVVDAFGIDFDKLKSLISIAATETEQNTLSPITPIPRTPVPNIPVTGYESFYKGYSGDVSPPPPYTSTPEHPSPPYTPTPEYPSPEYMSTPEYPSPPSTVNYIPSPIYVPSSDRKSQKPILDRKSQCQIPPVKVIYPEGQCHIDGHKACPVDSQWCGYCMKDINNCKHKKFKRIHGSYSFKK